MSDISTIFTRPWGIYENLHRGPHSLTKIITVNPGGKLSLQKHKHRSEHWCVIEGVATVNLNHIISNHYVGSHIFIPTEMVHRLVNETDKVLKIIEVQIGEILDENDIERLEDIYDRVF